MTFLLELTFTFKLEIIPEMGEIHLEGKAILKSYDQMQVQFIMQNARPLINKIVNDFVLKQCFINSRNIANENKIPFPPLEPFFKRHGIST